MIYTTTKMNEIEELKAEIRHQQTTITSLISILEEKTGEEYRAIPFNEDEETEV